MTVGDAVDSLLDQVEPLEGRAMVLAAVARALAGQLDAACASETARGLSAAPPIARRLVEVLRELPEGGGADSVEQQAARMLAPVRSLAGGKGS